MSGIVKRIGAFFRAGRGEKRYLAGMDLDQNSYYELPSPLGDPDPRRTRRVVRYREHKELGEFDQGTLPVQWSMWLRHTRRSAPTIEELVQDRERIASVQHNAFLLEQRDTQRKLLLEQKAQVEGRERQRIAQESYDGLPTTTNPHARATAVPTATVTDADASADADRRVTAERDGDGTFMQERTVDMEVWEASRRRVEEQAQAVAAQDGRLARRSALNTKDAERERARQMMSQSPLAAFDVSYGDEDETAPAPTPMQQQPATGQLKSRFGRAVGPDEEWAPESWQPRPVNRR